MKVLSAAQMREVDRKTIEAGIPGLVLMENAGARVVEYLLEEFSPLSGHRIVILCGKGNNGGDGMVVARQLFTRVPPRSLDVVLAAGRDDLSPDAAAQLRMLEACGCPVTHTISAPMRHATIVVDALLGAGLRGPVSGSMLEWIGEINQGFPEALVVAVDIPSGMATDESGTTGEFVHADATITFTAPKIAQALPPNCDHLGHLVVAAIGSPPSLYEDDPTITLSLVEPKWFRPLLAARPRGAHKGDFGHVLVIGGAIGKSGAAAMTGLAALRAGAGLVTVASPEASMDAVGRVAPELMTSDLSDLASTLAGKNVVALGPGLGTEPHMVDLARILMREVRRPVIVDADGLNALAGLADWAPAGPRILTPHPGEMGRLMGTTTAEVQRDRLAAARTLACTRNVTVVLKGQRSLIAFPDGRVWINPTGTPAMATGGSGDILTGLIAGVLAQRIGTPDLAVAAAVWLHGRSGELGAEDLGEMPLIATDLVRYLPEAIHACLGDL